MTLTRYTPALLWLGCVVANPRAEPSAESGRNVTLTGPLVWALNAVPPPNQPDADITPTILAKFKAAEVGDMFIECNTAFIYQGIAEHADRKRASDCTTIISQQVQVPAGQTGTWKGTWEPATGCFYSPSSGSCPYRDASVTTYWDPDPDFDQSTSNAVIKIINDDGSLNQGYNWAYQTSTSDSISCCPFDGEPGQVWTQSLYGWSNSQVQTCHTDTCYPYTKACGAWSSYQHSNWALANGLQTIQYTCSEGSDRTEC